MDQGSFGIRWLGHSGVQIVDREMNIVIDPVLRKRVAHLVRWHDIDVPELDQVDALLISHAHHDHLDMPSVRRFVEYDCPVYAPVGAASILSRAGFTRVEQVVPGDELNIDGVVVTVVHAEHDGRRYPWHDQHPHDAIGFIVNSSHGRIYAVGDTALFDGMQQFAPVEVVLLPIAGWWHTLGPGHLDFADAAAAVQRLDARVVIPVHWGTFRPVMSNRVMSRHRYEPLRQFEVEMQRVRPQSQVVALQPGGWWHPGTAEHESTNPENEAT